MAACREDMLYKDYTTNPIPTSFFISEIILRVMLQDYWEEQLKGSVEKRDNRHLLTFEKTAFKVRNGKLSIFPKQKGLRT